MRTSFQDWEDKQLVQIALQFEIEGIRITWDYVARRMAKFKRSARQLQLTYGKTIAISPPCFFSSASRLRPVLLTVSAGVTRRVRSVALHPTLPASAEASLRTSRVSRQAANVPLSATVNMQLPAEKYVPTPPNELQLTDSVSATAKSAHQILAPNLLTLPEVTCAMVSIFGDISAKDVRQHAGQMHNNAGELLPSGISAMLEALGTLSDRDVFLDVGAGISNVLAQVALTTKVSKCIGVERSSDTYPLLRKVFLKAADVRDLVLSKQPPTCEATIVFANYFLFEETAKLVVATELSGMLTAGVIAATSLFCPRHSARCSQPFCERWKLDQTVMVACSWKSELTPFYVYKDS
ncbi:Histone methylation protein DOT1 [Phytophthora palmivora]|uniref:Histone methylation protein DOT1 n=1 Tax=Phytophthora palmivora TaxID=4796 RepID=A0A2P4YE32_9STRA|nr:Histone methylation protein DOT1 [Phytophthora palmivora]